MPNIKSEYRFTPPGQPTVADLIKPGDFIRSSYGTGGLVVKVSKYSFCGGCNEIWCLGVPCPQCEAGTHSGRGLCLVPKPKKKCFPVWCYAIAYYDLRDDRRFKRAVKPRETSGINELVAVDGRILKAFIACKDEVFKVEQPQDCPDFSMQLSLQLDFYQ